MKTTLELPDELMRAIKVRAAREDRKLKDLVADLLRRGMGADAPPPSARVSFPLVVCEPVSTPDGEVTPDRVAQVLVGQETDWVQRP